MNASLLVPPASEPVSLADAKAWLRLDTSDEDALVSAAIVAAREAIEAATRRRLVTQTWRLSWDMWPDRAVASPLGSGAFVRAPALPIPLAPVASIAALRVFDGADVPQVVSSTTFRLCGPPDDARLVFSTAPPSPGRLTVGIELDLVIGYGAPADVPAPVRQALLMAVARLFEHRGDDEAPPGLLRGTAHDLLAPYRRVRVA